jgi:hypothetical protein
MRRLFLMVVIIFLSLNACGQTKQNSKSTKEDISQASEIIGVWKLAHHPH